MKFKNESSELYIPNGVDEKKVLESITHLAIGAHQDDAEIMAYSGIAECFGKKDKNFGAIIATDGRGSPRDGFYKNFSDEQMKHARIAEQKKAADIGQYAALALLNYHDVENIPQKPMADDIYNFLMASKPEVVYTHNLADKHGGHICVVLSTIEAIRRMPKEVRPKKLLGCEVWRGLDWLDDNSKILLNTSYSPNLANSLLSVFDSQISGGKRYDLATPARWLANATYAASHSADASSHLSYAMDLTPLIENENKCISSFVENHLMDFVNDVKNRLAPNLKNKNEDFNF